MILQLEYSRNHCIVTAPSIKFQKERSLTEL